MYWPLACRKAAVCIQLKYLCDWHLGCKLSLMNFLGEVRAQACDSGLPTPHLKGRDRKGGERDSPWIKHLLFPPNLHRLPAVNRFPLYTSSHFFCISLSLHPEEKLRKVKKWTETNGWLQRKTSNWMHSNICQLANTLVRSFKVKKTSSFTNQPQGFPTTWIQ